MSDTLRIDHILQHTTSLLSRDSDQILLEQLGIGYSQYKILRILHEGVSVQQRYIADMLGQTEASISRQINVLLDMGLISKTKDQANKRSRLIAITPKGLKMTNAVNEVLIRYHQRILVDLGAKQKDDLLKSLEEFHDKICHSSHSPSLSHLKDTAVK